MRLEKVQEALKTKKIHYEYTEENGCGSIDFMFRGLRFHIWEYEDRVWGGRLRGNYFRRNPLMAGYAAWDVSITAEGNDIYEKM